MLAIVTDGARYCSKQFSLTRLLYPHNQTHEVGAILISIFIGEWLGSLSKYMQLVIQKLGLLPYWSCFIGPCSSSYATLPVI